MERITVKLDYHKIWEAVDESLYDSIETEIRYIEAIDEALTEAGYDVSEVYFGHVAETVIHISKARTIPESLKQEILEIIALVTVDYVPIAGVEGTA